METVGIKNFGGEGVKPPFDRTNPVHGKGLFYGLDDLVKKLNIASRTKQDG
jgi:hypothetical protein